MSGHRKFGKSLKIWPGLGPGLAATMFCVFFVAGCGKAAFDRNIRSPTLPKNPTEPVGSEPPLYPPGPVQIRAGGPFGAVANSNGTSAQFQLKGGANFVDGKASSPHFVLKGAVIVQ